ncbi:MAG: phosphotransferase [Chthoniobacterales bacterium]
MSDSLSLSVENDWVRQQAVRIIPQLHATDFDLKEISRGIGHVRHYKLTTRDKTYFIRVVDTPGDSGLERSILDHLVAAGAKISPIVYSLTEKAPDSDILLRLDIRPFIEDFTFFATTDEDLRRTATELKTIHAALKSFPLRNQVKTAAITRSARLANCIATISEVMRDGKWSRFGELESWARAHRSWLEKLCTEFDPFLHHAADAQILHGDVHPGNILFCGSSRDPVFIDFEHSIYTFAPCNWDLAYLFQRFCLHDKPDAKLLAHRRDIVESAYGQSLEELPRFMRATSRLCVCILFNAWFEKNIPVPPEELEKFLYLEEQATNLQESWRKISVTP